MNRIATILILLTFLGSACATDTEEPAPEPTPVAQPAPAPPPPAPAPEPMPVVEQTAVRETIVMLPDTASNTPALALAGIGAIALAGGIAVVRRRLLA